MIVASFLTKDLLIPWQKGEEWMFQYLLDGDIASNVFNWQWVAGCGFDAAPFFRIFNPILQSKKFDSEGQYIKRFLPQLKNLSSRYIHAPWTADSTILKKANIVLGKNYPYPLVDLDAQRKKLTS